ncbi:MAG: hypothetical protein L0228_07535, partial [Planctomycetes bacterium]|nr:hypothetical protein [Planctomycetota bacterium]
MALRYFWLVRGKLQFCVGFVGLLLALSQPAQAQLRIVSYNTATGNVSPGVQTARAGSDIVLTAIGEESINGIARPIDVLLLQEQFSNAVSTQSFVDLLNGIYGTVATPTPYARGSLNAATSAPDGQAGGPTIVYNTQTVELIAENRFGTVNGSNQARSTMRYQLRPVGYGATADFYAYNDHYKAGSSTSDLDRRNIEASSIRNDATYGSDALGEGAHAIYVGDFNMQSSSEAAFQTLIAPGAGQANDPIDRLGSWNNNASFADIHTQAPCLSSCGGLTTGGMDDRFDFQLATGEFLDGDGLSYLGPTVPGMSGLAHSYHAFGNNGSTFNENINDPSNTYVFNGVTSYTKPQILDALHTVSDHIPVVADFQLPAIMEAVAGMVPATLNVGQSFNLDVMVSNSAPVAVALGADELTYSLTTSGSVSGSFLNQVDTALGGGNTHFVTLDTSTPGSKTGTITLLSTSQQAGNASIQIPVNYCVDSCNAPGPPVVAAQWTFETSIPTTAGPHAPEVGTGSALGFHAGATTYSNPTGNGSAESFSSTNWAVGDYYQFQVSTEGYQDISLELDHTSSNTGPRDWGIFYSTTGAGTFIDTGITYSVLANAAPNPTWNLTTHLVEHFYEFDLSSIAALDDQPTLFLRLVDMSTISANGGAVMTGGTSRVDNVTIIYHLMPAEDLPGDFNEDGVVDAADYVVW